MKHNHHNDACAQLVPVHFEFTDPAAITVCVVGTFNNWQPEAKALHFFGGGRWVKETVLMPGVYEYRLVDGKWMADPLVSETVPNPFGERNPVLRVVSPEASHLSDAASLPMMGECTSRA